MPTPQRLQPLLEQYDWATERLLGRIAGPVSDSGDGNALARDVMTDDEYFWEPVAACWSVRRRTDGPGIGAAKLLGTGDWGRDAAPEAPTPPPITTIAWRLDHLTETLVGRADHLAGTRSFERTAYESQGTASAAVEAFRVGVAAWREAILSVDESRYDDTGLSSYPYGSDAEETHLGNVWWMNQEILHHGAEIALLRDLYAHRGTAPSAH